MKIVFASNYFNHHQRPLSESLYKMCNGDYRFVETSEMRQERKNLGYQQDGFPDYVIQAHKTPNAYREAERWILNADLVIAGSAPEKLLYKRKKKDKLIFRYSERPLKNGCNPFLYLPRLVKWHLRALPGNQSYMLAASAYTASDYKKFGLYTGKAYCWGYFPETKIYGEQEKLFENKDPNKILWCGRFIDWKHPDDAVRLAKRLKDNGYMFSLGIIGIGEMELQLKTMIKEYALESCVHLLGSMPPEQVRAHMEGAGIFLLTSDRKEGWGAVLNEAMNSGCAVIGSHAAGAVPFMIQDNINGCVYRSGDIDMLYEKTVELLTNTEKQKRLGHHAYETIVSLWNAETAASRLLKLAECIIQGDKTPELFETGLCSKAPEIRDNWM